MKRAKINNIPYSIKAFLIALITAFVIFIPFIIMGEGYFTFFGDFNVQQIPFYQLAHEAVKSGSIAWNWNTDLGVNFIGSYSFYLLFSPFFWLTLPFPTSFVPYLMAPLLMLKMACAALTSCIFLQRFVKNKNYAVLGGLLYAFSGFSIYNIFFNHFHEAIVFFPLMLIGLEKLAIENKRGFFAFAVAVNAAVNYWFFIGEVVFTIIYFFLRCTSADWKMTFKKFAWAFFEAVIGLFMAMFAFLPSVLAIMGNPRTTADNLLNGWNFWLYGNSQRYPAILHSFFFPPELPSRPSFFPDHGAKWSSLSCWLPLFSMSGVIAYLSSKKRDWLRRAIIMFVIMALVPGFNSLFVALNNSYYTRWFYMLSLLFVLATIQALEGRDESFDLSRGFKFTAVFIGAVIAIVGFTPKIDDGELSLGIMKYPDKFFINSALALLSLIVLAILVLYLSNSRKFLRFAAVATAGISIVSSITFISMGRAHSNSKEMLLDTAIRGRNQIVLDNTYFARSDLYNCMDNLGMFWNIPNIQAFHSIVPVSIMDFYPTVGVKRDVSSKPQAELYQLRSLLSVRWLFIEQNEKEQSPMPGYRFYGRQMGYNVYENENFIPMGFTYDEYITRSQLLSLSENERSMAMMSSIVLEDEDAYGFMDILMQDTSPSHFYNYDTFTEAVNERRKTCTDSFEITNTGFKSTISLERENLVFFSVPYDKGWSATVNGEPVDVTKVNIGFVGVRAPKGNCEIEFIYHTPGLKLGIYISASATVNGEPVDVTKVNIGFVGVRAPKGNCEIEFIYHTPGLKLGIYISAAAFITAVVYVVISYKVQRKRRKQR